MRTKNLKLRQFGILLIATAMTATAVAAPRCESLFRDDRNGSHSRRDAAPSIESAGTVDLKEIPAEQWNSLAQKEIAALGDVIGIEGGVTKSPVRNQREGEDCWSYSICSLIESFLKKTKFTIKLSPEYNEFYHVYSQLETHLKSFKKVADKLKANPNDPDLQQKLSKLTATYAKHVRVHNLRFDDEEGDGIFQPDVGNEAPVALKEMERFGFVPFRVFKGVIKTAEDEKKLEDRINALVSQIIHDDVAGTTDLNDYKEAASHQLNEKLFQLLANALNPIYKAQIIRPTDTWNFEGQEFSPMSLMERVRQLGLDLRKNLRSFTATPETHHQVMKAIAVNLLTQDLPVPIGISMFADKVNAAGQTVTDFAEQTGLFTTSVCPGGPCQSENGSHEILVVNFIAKSTDPSIDVKKLTKAQKLDLLNQDKLIVTGLIIQNSWGPVGGLDVNGKTPPNHHRGGYYIITADYLLNTGLSPINDMYDIVLQTVVAAQFPELQPEK